MPQPREEARTGLGQLLLVLDSLLKRVWAIQGPRPVSRSNEARTPLGPTPVGPEPNSDLHSTCRISPDSNSVPFSVARGRALGVYLSRGVAHTGNATTTSKRLYPTKLGPILSDLVFVPPSSSTPRSPSAFSQVVLQVRDHVARVLPLSCRLSRPVSRAYP